MAAATHTGKRTLPLVIAQKAAGKLLAAFAPFCEQIAIAGSIRRGKAQVGDIEVVAIPRRAPLPTAPTQMGLFGTSEPDAAPRATVDLLERQLLQMIAAEMLARTPPPGFDTLPAWGARYKKLWVPLNARLGYVQLDLFLATPENWGAIFAIRTGPNDWNQALMVYINRHTPYRQDGGALVRRSTGQPVPTRTERAYFDVLRLPFAEPSMRDQNTAKHVFGAAARRVQSARMSYNNDEVVRAVIRQRLERGLDGGEAQEPGKTD